MGLILSRFRKKQSTKEILEEIQKKIEDIEEYKEHTEQQRKWLVGSLVVYSIVFYLIAAVFVCIYYMPTELQDILFFSAPFAIFPPLVYILKNVLTWYYRRKVDKNERTLKDLRSEKNKILDQVMETETYKVAKEIMELYAPDQLRQSLLGKSPSSGSPSQIPQNRFTTPAPITGSEVRRRIIPSPGSTPRQQVPPAYPVRAITPQSFRPGVNNDGLPPGPPMHRPVLPRERGVLDRFIEYLVGDGPANRYALVCRQCESHNGMALKEEFEYIAFRCAYCFYWNHARKQRPAAPRLETLNPRPVPPISPLQHQPEIGGAEDDEEEEEGDSLSSCEEESSRDEDSTSENTSSSDEQSGEEEIVPDSSSECSSAKVLSSQGSLEEDVISTTTSTSDEVLHQTDLPPTSSAADDISCLNSEESNSSPSADIDKIIE